MKMTGTEMRFWVCLRLNCLKLIRVLKEAMELGPAQGELKWTAAEPWLGGGTWRWVQPAEPRVWLELPLPLQEQIGAVEGVGR